MVATPYIAMQDEYKYDIGTTPLRIGLEVTGGEYGETLHHRPQAFAQDQRLEVLHEILPFGVVRVWEDLQGQLCGEEAIAGGDPVVLGRWHWRQHGGLEGFPVIVVAFAVAAAVAQSRAPRDEERMSTAGLQSRDSGLNIRVSDEDSDDPDNPDRLWNDGRPRN